jgi:hypothetical protein
MMRRRQRLDGRAATLVAVRRCSVLALLAPIALAACGGGNDDARGRVNAYIEQANTAQQRSAKDLERINASYQAFARGTIEPRRATADMATAQRVIRTVRERVAALQPPADARGLHGKLVAYLDMNLGLARETARLATYVPRATAATAPLAGDNRRMRRALRAAATPVDQAAALDRFARSLGGMLRDLRRLDPPPVLRPAHGDQIARLTSTRSLAVQLHDALVAQDAQGVARLLERFRSAASARRPRAKLAARAIDAYNRRLQALNAAYAGVQREQVRLDRTLN